MVPGDLVMQIVEATLNGVGAGTAGGQKQQLKAGMLPQPALDRLPFVDFVVVHHDIDPVKAPRRVNPVEEVQQVQKQPRYLPKPEAMMDLARAHVQGSG